MCLQVLVDLATPSSLMDSLRVAAEAVIKANPNEFNGTLSVGLNSGANPLKMTVSVGPHALLLCCGDCALPACACQLCACCSCRVAYIMISFRPCLPCPAGLLGVQPQRGRWGAHWARSHQDVCSIVRDYGRGRGQVRAVHGVGGGGWG